ncbi:MAG: SDR family oxidoreductase [Patescibacteria group bacterium]
MINKKIAVVTGTSRGIGFSIAQNLSKKGWIVYGISRTLPSQKHLFKCIKADILNVKQYKKLLDKIPNKVDLLINNAALGFSKKILEISEDDYEQIFSLNLKSVVFFTQHIINNCMKNKGTIINISSIASLESNQNDFLYSASKTCLNKFVLTLAKEVKNISVYGILPSLVATKRTIKKYNLHKKNTLQLQDVNKAIDVLLKQKYQSGTLLVVSRGKKPSIFGDTKYYRFLNPNNFIKPKFQINNLIWKK